MYELQLEDLLHSLIVRLCAHFLLRAYCRFEDRSEELKLPEFGCAQENDNQ